jgi:hypothetical protein
MLIRPARLAIDIARRVEQRYGDMLCYVICYDTGAIAISVSTSIRKRGVQAHALHALQTGPGGNALSADIIAGDVVRHCNSTRTCSIKASARAV